MFVAFECSCIGRLPKFAESENQLQHVFPFASQLATAAKIRTVDTVFRSRILLWWWKLRSHGYGNTGLDVFQIADSYVYFLISLVGTTGHRKKDFEIVEPRILSGILRYKLPVLFLAEKNIILQACGGRGHQSKRETPLTALVSAHDLTFIAN